MSVRLSLTCITSSPLSLLFKFIYFLHSTFSLSIFIYLSVSLVSFYPSFFIFFSFSLCCSELTPSGAEAALCDAGQ